MRVRILLLLAAALATTVPASASPDSHAATTLRAADLRLASVAFRLGTAASVLCPDPYPITGLLLHHLPEYETADRQRMITRYGLDRGPGVLATVADSPAAQSGLAAGDVLLTVDGKSFPDPRVMAAEPDRKEWRRQIQMSEALLETELRRGPARLQVLRNGEIIDVTLTGRFGCPMRVRLAHSSQLNAFADRGYVILTTRILQLARSDDELAIILGHELAHIVLDHEARLKEQHVPSGLLRSVGTNAARVRATEEEADRLGLQMAAAAGYDLRAAETVWRQFHHAPGLDLQLFRTHPSVRARERILDEVQSELKQP